MIEPLGLMIESLLPHKIGSSLCSVQVFLLFYIKIPCWNGEQLTCLSKLVIARNFLAVYYRQTSKYLLFTPLVLPALT